MKIANVISLLALVSPVVSALKGARRDYSVMNRHLKGDDGDGDGDGDGDDILDTTVGDALDQVLGGDLGDLQCFSGSSTVQVQNKGSIAMKDLQVGDKVLTSNADYQTVYAFAHKEVDAYAQFVQLTTDAGATLEITGEHLVFLQGLKHPIRAEALKVGDLLLNNHNDATAIAKIGSVTKQGLYAPLTKDGTILVNNILASSYVTLQKDTDMVKINNVNTPISQHFFLHMALSPLRMVCSMVHCESYDQQGLAPYVTHGVQFVNWAQQQNVILQVLLLAVAFALFAACMMMENTMGAPLVIAAVYGIMKANGVAVRKVKTL